MRPFEYFNPTSLNEACSLMSKYKDEAKVVAGGQSLLPMLKQRLPGPKYIINIKGLSELEYINDQQDCVKIGALTIHRDIETSPLIKKRFPLLSKMERTLASVQIRNWGTLGGNLCHADPSGDLGPVLIALGSKIRATSQRGVREIFLDQFFVDYLESALEADEILNEIEIPHLPPQTGTAYVKEAIRFGDNPIVSVAAVITLDREIVNKAQIVLGAVGKIPIIAGQGSALLNGKKVTPSVLAELGKAIAKEIEPTSDVLASEDYKRNIAGIIAKKAVSQAIEQAR